MGEIASYTKGRCYFSFTPLPMSSATESSATESSATDNRYVNAKQLPSGQIMRWLAIWFALALVIRFTHLTVKGAWMDEVATALFSLGNYSRMIPLNELISLDQILRPLQFTPGASVHDVVVNLLTEDNHPPAYFVLAHGWMLLFHGISKLFGTDDGYAPLWAARALSAFFGALAVPATYLLAWFSFRDQPDQDDQAQQIGLICAALMAVSPFSVFLSQEARHYTLAILAVIASLCCFVLAVRALHQSRAVSWGTVLAWIVINALGLSIHFFFGLTLIAEGMVLLVMLVQQCRAKGTIWRSAPWLRIYGAIAGTTAGGLIWLPILANFYGSPQTSFLQSEVRNWQFWVNPIVQSLAGWLYAILSPVTKGMGWLPVAAIVITSVFLLLIYAPWLIATLQRSLRVQWQQPNLRMGIQAIGGFFILANMLFFIICYGLGTDITRGHRYSFVFFPSILILVGVSLAPFWLSATGFETAKLPFIQRRIQGRGVVALVIAVGFIGTQVMVNDLTSLKFYTPKALIEFIQTESNAPVVIGAATTITEQPIVVGIEIMSAAWEIQRNFNPKNQNQNWVSAPQFVIAENNAAENREATAELIQSLAALPRPFDLWLLDFGADLASERCALAENASGNQGSFNYTHYVCGGQA